MLVSRWPVWRCALVLLFLLLAERSAPAHVLLIAPTGGESLDLGSGFNIEWEVAVEHETQNWDLWYSVTSNDGPWIDIATNLPAGNTMTEARHNFNWIPDVVSDQAWVRVRQDNAGDDYFDVSASPFSIASTTDPCDFNSDSLCDITDLNSLLAKGPISQGVAANDGNVQFDLTGDGVIDTADLDQWLVDAAATNGLASPYKRGDANLDGLVDGTDFVNWNAGKFSSSIRWDEGDLDGTGEVDGLDFVFWNENKFSASDVVSSVPEAHSLGFAVVAILGLRFLRNGFRGP